MALSKLNLVRLKDGEVPEQGDLITYRGESGVYQFTKSGDFIDGIAGQIKTASVYNDANFYGPTNVPVKAATVRGSFVSISNQTLDLGALAYESEVVKRTEGNDGDGETLHHGAYSAHWVSVDDPAPASGKNGDLWFVI